MARPARSSQTTRWRVANLSALLPRLVHVSAPADPNSILDALDPEQRLVATALGGPVAVVAGAGTGKTRAITHRIAYAVATGAQDPRSVLAVTFTTRAAGEMRARLHELGVGHVQARTFHSAAMRQLRFFWPTAMGTELPQVTSSTLGLVAEAAARQGVQAETARLRDLASEISWAKVSNVSPSQYPGLAAGLHRAVSGVDAATVGRVFNAYEQVKRTRGLMDFDDILLCVVALMHEHPQVAERIRATYRHLVVDEFQDVSSLQRTLLGLWLGEGSDVCVVGDPNQSIHAFAGADPKYLTRFAQDFPQAQIVQLVRNYRSTPQVLQFANALMTSSARQGSGRGVVLRPTRGSGVDVESADCPDEPTEARSTARWLAQLHQQGIQWHDMAVLFRINAQAPAYEAALSDKGIPYLVRDSERFYERPEIRRALAALTAQARTEPDGEALPGVTAVLGELGWTSAPPEGSGRVREQWESLQALLDLAEELLGEEPAWRFGELMTAIEQRASLQQAPTLRGVTLSTIHSAKGLEWAAVALVGAHEGMLPFALSSTPRELDEEKRLCYVAITRARDRLRISWSRRGPGGRGHREPSRFLAGLVVAANEPAKSGSASMRRRRGVEQCRVCGKPLAGGVELKLGRHSDCPSSFDEDLLMKLKEWRLQAARRLGVPAYVIFTDATLQTIAETLPGEAHQLREVRGVGAVKFDRHGEALLALVAGATVAEVLD